jgi:hypothetical protein
VHLAIAPGYWRQYAYKRETDATREALCVVECNDQPEAGDGSTGRTGVTERPILPRKLGNAGGGKGP